MRNTVKDSTEQSLAGRSNAFWMLGVLSVCVTLGLGCSSTRMLERHRAQSDDPFARITNDSPVHAWEFGSCDADSDCVPQGCHSAVCSPAVADMQCIQGSILGACLSQVASAQCGCEDGMCRWTRSPEVMQCVAAAEGRPTTTPVMGTPRGTVYPARQRD